MKKQPISDRAKRIILSRISLTEYKKVMELHMDGLGKVEIAEKTGYSIRQVERIIPRCWKEVCISLAENPTPKAHEGWERWGGKGVWRCIMCGHLLSMSNEDEVPEGYICPECGGII